MLIMYIICNSFCRVVDFCCCCVLEYQLQIEWQWRELGERLEKCFTFPLNELKEQGHCDPGETKEDNRTSALQHVVLYYLFHGFSKITRLSWTVHKSQIIEQNIERIIEWNIESINMRNIERMQCCSTSPLPLPLPYFDMSTSPLESFFKSPQLSVSRKSKKIRLLCRLNTLQVR